MATVKDLLAIKGSRVLSIHPDATALEGAQVMNEHKIGALLVMEGTVLLGIIKRNSLFKVFLGHRKLALQLQHLRTPVRC